MTTMDQAAQHAVAALARTLRVFEALGGQLDALRVEEAAVLQHTAALVSQKREILWELTTLQETLEREREQARQKIAQVRLQKDEELRGIQQSAAVLRQQAAVELEALSASRAKVVAEREAAARDLAEARAARAAVFSALDEERTALRAEAEKVTQGAMASVTGALKETLSTFEALGGVLEEIRVEERAVVAHTAALLDRKQTISEELDALKGRVGEERELANRRIEQARRQADEEVGAIREAAGAARQAATVELEAAKARRAKVFAERDAAQATVGMPDVGS